MFARTLGIDLSADARNSAAVEMRWDGDRPAIVQIWGRGRAPLTDKCLLELLDRQDTKIGVDCPFGWPLKFMHLMDAETHCDASPFSAETPQQRKTLVYRATDLYVIERTEVQLGTAVRPLSVSADRIAHVALRFASLRSRLRVNKHAPRDGSGALVEVYPAAALALWNAPSYRKYKGPGCETQREKIVAALCAGVPDIMSSCANIDEHRSALIASDHVLDAFICALVARDADLRGVQLPSAYRDAARREGWIHLPQPRPGHD